MFPSHDLGWSQWELMPDTIKKSVVKKDKFGNVKTKTTKQQFDKFGNPKKQGYQKQKVDKFGNVLQD